MAAASLTTGPLPKHIRNIALPMSIGFLFNTLYNVVDSYFAGQISTSALAAMALCFPVFFIILAASQGLARGASVLIANAIGAQDHDKEAALSGQVLSIGACSAIFITGVGLLSAPTLFKILGASGDYLDLATSYIRPIFMGTIFFILSSTSNSILLAHGDSKTFGKVLVVGFFLNLILDPWFLYGGLGLPAMGIAGIAWATVLIQALGGFYLFAVLVRRGHVTLSCCHHLKPSWKIYTEILQQAVPTGFNMASIAVGFFVITYYLKFYGESAVAAFGVGTRIEQMALLPTIGLGAAIVSIVGQNNGAGEYARVVQCVNLCIKYGVYLIVIASIFMYLLAAPLVRLFTDDPEVIDLGTTYIRIMVFIQWAYVMSFIHIGFLQAVKKPMYGFFEAVTRKIILPLGVFYIVVDRLQSELNQLWFSIAAINVAVTMVTIIYAQSKLRKFY
ncbi:MAG: MATE family efflux transporter [Verrucomicrobiales bacterium]|nr:MATE family efflux transporter [Verrucomicrobiales bacterium]